MEINSALEIRLLSSLEKVFADEEPIAMQWDKGSMLMNEVYSFQAAYKWNGNIQRNVAVKVNSEIKSAVTVSSVGLVPCEMPCYADHDDNILRSAPGLYPDILCETGADGITLIPANGVHYGLQSNLKVK
jgi:hypothetical protein